MKREKETMRPGYYIHERSAEWESVERWENEGGRLAKRREEVLNNEAINRSGFSHFNGGAGRRGGHPAMA
jgi:hypothetical protein